MRKMKTISSLIGGILLTGASANAMASCADIFKSWDNSFLTSAIGVEGNGGYGLPMWISVVDETGKVCAVANSAGSGETIGNSSWLGSRVVSMQKAASANSFSLDGFSIATSNLYGLTQPGGSLYGLQFSNPVDPAAAYFGSAEHFGAGVTDPAVGKRIGGINVFGGGLALYNSENKKVGAIGVSGDTSCTDHAVAWRLRALMGLNHVPAGFISGYAAKPDWVIGDEMIIGKGDVANTYKQPSCAHNAILNPTTGAETGVIVE